jgi:hypothetical protein
MRVRVFVSSFMLAMSVGWLSEAQGATLFTTTAHTARVSVGTGADATSAGPFNFTSGTSLIMSCSHSGLQLAVSENSDLRTTFTVTRSSFSSCAPFSPWVGTHQPRWRLTVSGTGVVIGAFTRYSATLHNLAFDLAGGLYTGRLETGVTATQSTVGTSPICFDFNGAGTVSGPLTGDGRVDTEYCLTGAAAAFSFTN